MKRVAVLIDGGFIRAQAKRDGVAYDTALIEKVGHVCSGMDEELQRVLYYDCPPFRGTMPLPISGAPHAFVSSDQLMQELAHRDLFAVRRGVLKFKGWTPKHVPIGRPVTGLQDSDFRPTFEQKGVDMRIGLDMANYAANRSVDVIALVTNDTDCIPAMKYARRAGLQVALICLPNCSPAKDLLGHCDFIRKIGWP